MRYRSSVITWLYGFTGAGHTRSVSSLTILCHCTLPITPCLSPHLACPRAHINVHDDCTSFPGGHCYTIFSLHDVHNPFKCMSYCTATVSVIHSPVGHYSIAHCFFLVRVLHVLITHHVVQLATLVLYFHSSDPVRRSKVLERCIRQNPHSSEEGPAHPLRIR